MNVLYISYDGLTDTLGRSQVLPYLCGLSDKGHQITVLSCDKPNIYKLENEKVKQITEANNILWYSVPYSKKYPIISALHNMRNMKRMAIKLCKENHYQLVHCRSYMAGSIGLDLKRNFHVKLIFDMRGFFADERVDGHVWNRKELIYNLVYKYFKYKEKQLQSQADYIISLTNAGKKVMIEQMHVTTPIEVIPCCADLHHFSMQNVHEEEKSQLRKELKINDDDFVISYVGSFGTWYMFSEMMDFVSVLMQKRAHVKFLILTPDDRQQIIIAAAKTEGIDKDAIICEDLGTLTYPVEKVMEEFSLNGMRVTQFVKPEDANHPYRGKNTKQKDWIMLGTHDNEPISMWAEATIKTPEIELHAKNLAEDLCWDEHYINSYTDILKKNPQELAKAKLVVWVAPSTVF